MPDDPALLLVGHGTRSAGGIRQYWELAGMVRAQVPRLALGGGFIELAEPGLDTAIDELAGRGARSIVAVPLVLLGAGHMKDDGPAALGRARRRHPAVRFAYARALGIHPLVLAAAEQRARSTVGAAASTDPAPPAPPDPPGPAGPPDDWAVALVGRGSSDPDANADLFKVARLLQESRGFAQVEAGFVSLARPSVSDVLDRCRRLGAARVMVLPYFLFTGVLVARIHEQAAAWRRAHPHVEVRCAGEIGPDPRVAALVVERYREAVAGTARMNCDCCAYRVTMPGHEAKVGRPLALHTPHHHDDGGR